MGMELYSGEQLFATHEELEHLALMEQIIGPLPEHMLERASDRGNWLRKGSGGWRLNWPDGASSSSSRHHVARQKRLAEQVMPQHSAFASMVATLLTVDPGRRPSASDALKHPFFDQSYED